MKYSIRPIYGRLASIITVGIAMTLASTARADIVLDEGITPLSPWPEPVDIQTGDPSANSVGVSASTATIASQTFTPAYNSTLGALYLSYSTSAASAPNSFTLKIQQVPGGPGVQTYTQGTNLLGPVPATFSLASTSGSKNLLRFEFSGADQIPLNKGTTYAIEISSTSSAVTFYRRSADTYAGGNAYSNRSAVNYPGTRDLAMGVIADPVSPFGISMSASSKTTLSQWLPQIAATGINSLRGFSLFSTIEPTEGTWKWTQADTIMNTAASNNMSEMGMLGLNASWINSNVQTLPIANLSAWSTYVAATVDYCKDNVSQWEVWNEPPNFTSGGTPTQYASTVAAAYDAAKTANPDCRIGLAAKSVNVNWLDQTIASGAAGKFDFVTLHPYEVLSAVGAGWEGQYMSIVPTVRKMLAAKDPDNVNAPIWFTELGTAIGVNVQGANGANVTVTEDIQAQLLVKAYAMGIAQGVTCINWFEGRDGDSGAFGLLTSTNVPRLAYTAMSQMIEHLSACPTYLGWVQLNASPVRDYGFVFQGAAGTVMAAWASPGVTDNITFASPVTIVNPQTGGTTNNVTTYALTNAPVLILGVPSSIVTQAHANLTQPFPWGGDYSGATSVSIPAMGNPNTENGLHQFGANARSTYGTTPYGAARYCGTAATQYFTVDPNFLSYNTTPITITAVLRRNSANDNAGFNLRYESTTGWKSTGSWYTVPGNSQWYTKTWTINDAQFVGNYGYHFSFESDSTTYSKYYIQSLTVSK